MLAGHLAIPATAITYVVADNVSACLGADGGKPSVCAYLDVLRHEFARVAARASPQEVFTPAQHDTGWSGPLGEMAGVL